MSLLRRVVLTSQLPRNMHRRLMISSTSLRVMFIISAIRSFGIPESYIVMTFIDVARNSTSFISITTSERKTHWRISQNRIRLFRILLGFQRSLFHIWGCRKLVRMSPFYTSYKVKSWVIRSLVRPTSSLLLRSLLLLQVR